MITTARSQIIFKKIRKYVGEVFEGLYESKAATMASLKPALSAL
jgi:hypothetical protein